jgi:hypothetical protein
LSGWIEAGPAVLTAAGVLLVPGLIVGLAAGLRGLAAIGLAAPLSVTIVALTAVVAGRLGVSFGLAPVAVATAAAAITALVASRFFPAARTYRSGRGVAAASAMAGAAIGGMCAAVAVVRGITEPNVFPQTYDALFHLSAVWQVLQTGDASSLTLGTVAAPGRSAAFYPAAWHGVAALVVEISGAPVVVAVNALSVGIAVLVWPLGCVLLARQLLGERPGVLFAAGVLSAAFGASPYLLLSYGTVWPNALANALLPSVLACAVSVVVVRSPRDFDGLGRARTAAMGVAVLPGLALAHPNAVPSAMLYITVMALVTLWRWGFGVGASTRYRLTAAAGAAVMLGVELCFVTASPVFAATRRTSWPARQSLAQAAGEWALSAPVRSPVPWLAAALVLVGCVVASRRPELRWLVLAHAAAGAAFVLVAGSDGRVARAFSGPWYDDPFRLAALLGVTAVPLAALGLERVATLGLERVATLRLSAAAETSARVGLGRPQAVIACTALVAAGLTGGMYAGANSRVLGAGYDGQSLAGPAERTMLERLPLVVPSGVRVAGNPWNGSTLASPLGDRATVFPHVSGTWDPDRALLAASLNRAEDLPAVCAAVRRLDVGYVIDGTIEFWKGDPRQARYPGLEVSGHPGFAPVAHGGRLTLYRVTACS